MKTLLERAEHEIELIELPKEKRLLQIQNYKEK